MMVAVVMLLVLLVSKAEPRNTPRSGWGDPERGGSPGILGVLSPLHTSPARLDHTYTRPAWLQALARLGSREGDDEDVQALLQVLRAGTNKMAAGGRRSSERKGGKAEGLAPRAGGAVAGMSGWNAAALRKRGSYYRVCPYLHRIGFPLGGCLHSYQRPPPPPVQQQQQQPAVSHVTRLQRFRQTWPTLFLLGGSLG